MIGRNVASLFLALSMTVTSVIPSNANITHSDVKPYAIQDDNELKIASFNIAAKGNNTTAIGEALKEEQIDIVGFQEVDKFTSRNNKDMLKEIAEGIGFDYSFRKNIDYGGGEYGIGIAAASDLNFENGADLETDGYEGRGWQRAEVQVGDKTVAVYNTHLTWEVPAIREKQMKAVLEAFEEDKVSYKVLTGDFNAQESNDEFDLYLRNYKIANGKDEKWLDTYIPADSSMKTHAIDNIITTRNIKISNVEAIQKDKTGSDHKMLVATCELLEEEEVTTQLLNKTIKNSELVLTETDRYTEKALANLSTVISDIKSSNFNTQKEVNNAIDRLEDTIQNLEKLPIKFTDPIAYWDFEGDSPTVDKTGRGNNGVEKGNVSYVDGLDTLGKALSTKDGYISVEKTTNDLKLGTTDFTVGFWYKATNPGDWSAVLGDKDWNSGANPGMAVVQGQGQFYTTYAANGHAQQENIVGGTAGKVYDNKWHYIVAMLDRDNTSTLYVDGNKIASTSIASTANADATVPNPFNIGADGKGNYRINSLIDDVKVYRTVLSEEEIMAEYELNRDKSEVEKSDLIKKTEKYLDGLTIDPTVTTKLETFETDKYISKIFCSENDVTIDDEGNILRQPLVDKKVQVTYIVQEKKDGVAYDEGTFVKNKWITLKGKEVSGKNEKPVVIPDLQEWKGDNSGAFTLTKDSRIVLSDADKADFQQVANILKADIEEIFGYEVDIVTSTPVKGDIVLTHGTCNIVTEDKETQELIRQAYVLDVHDYVTISATAYKGSLYGTRSLLQAMMTSDHYTIAHGTAVDYPNYPIRKFMLDLGRKYFPMWYLNDVVKYASWFKLTDFQAHISEDTFNDYSAFRLESKIPHLTSTDGYYTKQEYRDFQAHAKDYGIRVITEIDGPAHARRFIELGKYPDSPDKYKDLGLDGTHFNLSEEGGARERVLNLMDEIFEEFLGGENPVITTDAFNVGMDEYFGDKNDLRAYGVHVLNRIVNDYGKTAFAWDSDATLANDQYPKERYPMDDMYIDYWKWEEVNGGLKALMDQGYKVINGDHRWYIVPGAQIGFYDYANEERLYNELSAGNMVGWYGNGIIFPEGHPSIAGGTMLLWNDRGMFAGYTVNDIFARQRSQYPYLAQSYWSGKNEEISFNEFKETLNKIEVGPGLDNLYNDIDSKTELVYDFDMETLSNNQIEDKSGNGYNAQVFNGTLTDGKNGKQLTFDGNGYIATQHKALKWPYTLAFDLTISPEQEEDIVLFEQTMPKQGCVEKDGKETGQEKRVVVLKKQDDGTYRFTYSRENFTFEHNFTFKKGQPYRIVFTSDESKITGGEYSKWNQPTKLFVNGNLVSTLQGPERPEGFKGTWWVDSPSINLPLEKIAQNLVGSLDNFKLYNRLLTDEEIRNLGGFEDSSGEVDKNLALNKPATASSEKSSDLKSEFANDGSLDTRWGSNYNSSENEPFDKVEWLQIDLQNNYALDLVKLNWEDAYAQQYTIQLSDDGVNFTDVKVITEGDGKEDVIELNGATGRYLRIYCQQAVPSEDNWKWNYGYSLREVEAYGKEVIAVNTSALETLINEAKTYDKDNYTLESYTAFNKVLTDAEALLIKEKLTQAEVDTMVETLQGAIDALVLKDADYSKVDEAIAKAEALNKDLYKDFSAVETAINAVKEGLKINEQAKVDAMAKAIEDAISGLEYKDADYSKVDEAIAKVPSDLSPYTEESVKAVNDALHAVVRDLDITKQAEVDAMAKAINDAIDALEEVVVVDKSALEEGIKDALKLKEKDYTADSWKDFKQALENATTILGKEDATQAEVNAATEALKVAKEALKELKPMKPIEPANPSNPTDPDEETNGEAPSTSDTMNIVGLMSMLLLSGFAIEEMIRRKRQSKAN